MALHPRCTVGHAATGCAARLSIRRSSRVIYQYTYCLRLFSKFVLRLPRVFHTPLGGEFLNGQPNNDWGGRMSAFGESERSSKACPTGRPFAPSPPRAMATITKSVSPKHKTAMVLMRHTLVIFRERGLSHISSKFCSARLGWSW